jgi:pyrroline-5-carboxylate reductase
MPNTPAVVGLSATAMAVADTCGDDDRAWARTLLQSIGIVVDIDETMLDAFTGLIGSGPAYVFYVAESLQAAAVAEGFEEVTSAKLVAQLLVGAAALLEREPQHARELRQRVTSPNGTTAAGVAALNDRKAHDAFIAAVRAATQRSKELGDA